MILQSLVLQNFRNYTKTAFTFNKRTTLIAGPNASGKSNLLEAIWLLSTGKGARQEKEQQLLHFHATHSRIQGVIENEKEGDDTTLEAIFSMGEGGFIQKKYMVNNIAKRRADFAGNLPAVLFTPVDLEIVIGSPGDRRRFLDDVLGQTDREYSLALDLYGKALRQRNALLEYVQKTGRRNQEAFPYWDNLLILNGQKITQKRQELIGYINARSKQFFPFILLYDSSVISEERLVKYQEAEVRTGVTLVGPHRDDFFIQVLHPVSGEQEEAKLFSSRGEQRLIVLELRLSQIEFIEMRSGDRPILLLDDIFSELDRQHIAQVLSMTRSCQTLITTTHKEFAMHELSENTAVIELK